MVTQNMLYTCEGKSIFEDSFKCATAVYPNKGLKQIKLPVSFHTCAPIFQYHMILVP